MDVLVLFTAVFEAVDVFFELEDLFIELDHAFLTFVEANFWKQCVGIVHKIELSKDGIDLCLLMSGEFFFLLKEVHECRRWLDCKDEGLAFF